MTVATVLPPGPVGLLKDVAAPTVTVLSQPTAWALASSTDPFAPLPLRRTVIDYTPFVVSSRYTHLALIARGSGTTLVSATDVGRGGGGGGGGPPPHARRVAIKKVPDVGASAAITRHVLREVRILRAVSHPHLLRLLDVAAARSDGGVGKGVDVYLVTPLAAGGDLGSVLADAAVAAATARSSRSSPQPALVRRRPLANSCLPPSSRVRIRVLRRLGLARSYRSRRPSCGCRCRGSRRRAPAGGVPRKRVRLERRLPVAPPVSFCALVPLLPCHSTVLLVHAPAPPPSSLLLLPLRLLAFPSGFPTPWPGARVWRRFGPRPRLYGNAPTRPTGSRTSTLPRLFTQRRWTSCG